MTAKELGEDLVRYLHEAAREWADNFEDSPPSHVFTAIFTILLFSFLRWIL